MNDLVCLTPTSNFYFRRWDLVVFSSQADFRVETSGGALASFHLKLGLITKDVFARAAFPRMRRLFSRHCSEKKLSFTLKSEEFEELRPGGTFSVKLALAGTDSVPA